MPGHKRRRVYNERSSQHQSSTRYEGQYDVNKFLSLLVFPDDSVIFAYKDAEATDIIYHIAALPNPMTQE